MDFGAAFPGVVAGFAGAFLFAAGFFGAALVFAGVFETAGFAAEGFLVAAGAGFVGCSFTSGVFAFGFVVVFLLAIGNYRI